MARKLYFTPQGYPCTGIMMHGWQSQDLLVNDDGALDADGADDYPDMQPFHGVNKAEFLSDFAGNEFLVTHCRLVEVYEDFDQHDDFADRPPIEAWDESIVADCERAARLQDTARMLKWFRDRAPKDMKDDATMNAALDHIVLGRIEGEWGELELRIAAYRKNREEPKVLEAPEDDSPMTECANCDWEGHESRLKPIKDIGQRVMPGEMMPAGECPVCGALAHLKADDEQLLDKADQKHAAQMEDMSDD